ncbi:aab81d49-6d71-42a3-b264-12a14fc165dc [Sclerotinia trifoliorum]|uniref:Aab81d49-6d71-42a3-b264-12a14fc165dc n=1 Tax=Sclerotinia trifoliorum TaxID=28548 RepID=A0A8H2VQW3_9HELO|nr:aab81d49-6d71-42a3-b264-12a14fc165dc [Sclerotinia trifoliorum]
MVFSRLFNSLRPKASRNRLRSDTDEGESAHLKADSDAGSTVNTLRSRASRKKLRKEPPPRPKTANAKGTGNLQDFRPNRRSFDHAVDEQTGERIDHTALLHGLAHMGSFDSMHEAYGIDNPDRPPGERAIASFSPNLWDYIVGYLSPSDAASLAFSTKTLLNRIGKDPWHALNLPENHRCKIEFLVHMDRDLPNHLLCFPCAIYHVRIIPGEERLKATHIINHLFECPNALTQVAPKTRLTVGHTLPFSFVQLVLRSNRYSPNHGIPVESICKRWKDPQLGAQGTGTWSHQSRYYIDKGHLLLRVISQCFPEPDLPISAQRNLLYSREDYFPYFSVCAHWRDGDLMDICKCALGHIPKRREAISSQLKSGPNAIFSLANQRSQMSSQCSVCQPMRRCPRCPTEYLVELKFAEDKNDQVNRFKQAMTVTRWSDLGNGTSPLSPEWAAINGEFDGYDSLDTVKGRAISGTFESQFGVTLPGQRILSLNPRNEIKGEDGHNWY